MILSIRFQVALCRLCGAFGAAILVWGSSFTTSLAGSGEPVVRVRVLEGVRSVRLAGEDLRADSAALGTASTVRAAGGQIRIGSQVSPGPVWVTARGGVIVDGERYPGEIALLTDDSGRLDVVNRVPLEPYVEGIVAGELYADWPDEVLKAQAVIARTFALYEADRNRARAWDLEASVISQSYRTEGVSPRIHRNAAATQGEVLIFEGKPILAAYHSSAGGRTAACEEVWGQALPYLRGVSSPDDNAPDHFWSYEIEQTDLERALREAGFDPGRGGEPRVLERSPSGRVRVLRVGDAQLSGRELRQVLGGAGIRSTLFDVRTQSGQVRFLGSGSGHGVGMSQWGARELARRGRAYDEILAHYYVGSELVQRFPPDDLATQGLETP